MYPQPNLTWIEVEKLTEHLCGAGRPDHFRGVGTVVAKLFHTLRPDIAYFGQKDAQQLAVVRRIAADLNLPVEIRACPIIREPDGLALSSRNRYLDPDQRRQAVCLFQALEQARTMIRQGQRDGQVIIEQMGKIIRERPLARIDYIQLVDNDLLQPISRIEGACLLAAAVYIGPVRLIDNITVDPDMLRP